MLTPEQIERLASREGVRRVAVENFLGSLDGSSAVDAFQNLRADARSYGWNEATRTAIADGIRRHFERSGS